MIKAINTSDIKCEKIYIFTYSMTLTKIKYIIAKYFYYTL